MNRRTLFIVKAGIIAAIYFALTIVLGQFGYGIIQVRISEAMTILPLFEPAAIPGLFIGCLFANFAGGFGFADIVFGSLTTLLAAYLTSKMPNKYLGTVPPILLNAFLVSIWVSKLSNAPYLATAFSIGFGEFISAGILGVILASVFERVVKR
jgi:uncharacterized membrane protein